MTSKAAALSTGCLKCKSLFKRNDETIKCGVCCKSLHVKCAIDSSSGLNEEVIKYIKECNEELL